MLLENLLECVNGIRERIEAHGSAFRKSEAQTRYALIDPLLRELGWDTQDPALVVPEYQSGKVRADYALMSDNTPAMMVEAKSLDTPLRDVVRQGIGYCLEEGTGHFAVTDGRRWGVYETFKRVPIDEKRIVSFDLQDQSPAEVCLQALALWRPAVQSGNVAPGQAPVVSLTPEEPVIPDTQLPPVVDEHEWRPLSELVPETQGPKPRAVMFPDLSRASIDSWKSMLIEVMRWLIKAGHLTTGRCPVPYSDRSKRHVVGVRPFHADGSPFNESGRVLVDSFHIDTKHSAKQTAQATRSVIEHVGQDPAQFKVRFS